MDGGQRNSYEYFETEITLLNFSKLYLVLNTVDH